MPRYEFDWNVTVKGKAMVDAATEEEAQAKLSGSLGGGISIASNLHAPPGVQINAKFQVVAVDGQPLPKLTLPANDGVIHNFPFPRSDRGPSRFA